MLKLPFKLSCLLEVYAETEFCLMLKGIRERERERDFALIYEV
jgi:hypothetical protein